MSHRYITLTAIAGLLFAVPVLVFSGQNAGMREVETLIKNLGSSSFQVRQEAFAALKERPDAMPALETALKSPDRELAKRAEEIIDFHKCKPVRDLESAVNNGQVERFVQIMLDWPDGKYETEAWTFVSEFANKLRKAHEKAGGAKLQLSTESIKQHLKEREIPLRIREKRITGLANGAKDEETKSRGVYLCADEIRFDAKPVEKPPETYRWAHGTFAGAIIARQSVFASYCANDPVIFCAGRVELSGVAFGVLVVSAGDVVLDAEGLVHSLVIAKGNIIVKNHRIERTRLIAGKKVITDDADGDLPSSCLISQNDPNPLGFIRWADAAKDKAAPKSK